MKGWNLVYENPTLKPFVNEEDLFCCDYKNNFKFKSSKEVQSDSDIYEDFIETNYDDDYLLLI